jgi:hypothetical protein
MPNKQHLRTYDLKGKDESYLILNLLSKGGTGACMLEGRVPSIACD